MTLKKHIESTTAASNPSWTIRSTTFIAGWWKSSPMATLTPWAIIRTPHRRAITSRSMLRTFCRRAASAVSSDVSMTRSLMSLTLALAMSLGGSMDASAGSLQHKRKSKKPSSPPCRFGCKPETAAPQVATDTPEDEALQKELSALAREVRNGSQDSYARLSAFATKNTTNAWGARAALALGYQDFSKNRMPQALGWLLKAQNDALLREYALYWTAQAQLTAGRKAEAYKVLQTLQHDASRANVANFRPDCGSVGTRAGSH